MGFAREPKSWSNNNDENLYNTNKGTTYRMECEGVESHLNPILSHAHILIDEMVC